MIKVRAIETLKWKEKPQVRKMENLFFFSSFREITYILAGPSRGFCLISAYSHVKFIFPVAHKDVINEELEKSLLRKPACYNHGLLLRKWTQRSLT